MKYAKSQGGETYIKFDGPRADGSVQLLGYWTINEETPRGLPIGVAPEELPEITFRIEADANGCVGFVWLNDGKANERTGIPNPSTRHVVVNPQLANSYRER